MSFKISIKLDDKKLRRTIAAVKDSVVSIGVLSKNATRADGLNNAQLGLVNEVGGITADGKLIPARSFLRVPLTFGMPKHKAKIAEAVFAGAVADDMPMAMDIVGNIGVRVVDDAFATGGNGEWRPNAEETLRKKAPATNPLIWHGDLRKSVAYEVKTK